MTRDEALSLGVPEERLKEFQEYYGRDLQRAVNRKAEGSSKAVRTAIESMLPLIRRPAELRKILDLTTRLYCSPDNQWPEENV